MGIGIALGLVSAIAGIGLLYLLRGAGIADVGPRSPGALPLEQLARADAQPLARMALAWLPVGIAAGGVLASFTRGARMGAALLVTGTAAVLLVVSGGVSVAVENSEPLTSHLTGTMGLGGTWVSVSLLFIGVLAGQALAAASASAPSAE